MLLVKRVGCIGYDCRMEEGTKGRRQTDSYGSQDLVIHRSGWNRVLSDKGKEFSNIWSHSYPKLESGSQSTLAS